MRIKHLEKIILGIVLVLFGLSILVPPSSPKEFTSLDHNNDIFTSKRKSGTDYFIFAKEISIMPGEAISYFNQDGVLTNEYKIKSILVPARENVDIYTQNEKITGLTRQEFVLEDNWNSFPGFFAIRQGKNTLQIKISDILKIKGKLWLSIDAELDDLNDKKNTPSFYQKTIVTQPDKFIQEKVKWLSPGNDGNISTYDLFTPPIIYIHDGELTAKLPEAQTEDDVAEPFGITLIGITKMKYPLRLISWVGQTPYFDDLQTTDDQTEKVVRNRIEVGKPYKRVANRKPGQQSFEICENNDSEKFFTVQYFTVQQYRNPETGGLKPVGRAMILDHKLGGAPFEINTLMKEVDAGNFTIDFEASLPGLNPMNFKFESSQTSTTVDYGGRRYLVSELNREERTIKITKQDPRLTEDSYQVFSF